MKKLNILYKIEIPFIELNKLIQCGILDFIGGFLQ